MRHQSRMHPETQSLSEPPSFDLAKCYHSVYIQDGEASTAIATLKTLMMFLQEDKSTTGIELTKNFRSAIEQLKQIDPQVQVESVAEIYFRFITLNSEKFLDFNELKQELGKRSMDYIQKVRKSRTQLARVGEKFITDDCVILVHSHSRAVYETLRLAMDQGKRFTIYVTESGPDYRGREMARMLGEDKRCNVTSILDAAMGYIMERVDLVLVGAEGVTESGGIINKIGTYPLAICAKAHNKTFYALAESHKFIRQYPLTQLDLPPQKSPLSHPSVDYTPPKYITLLLTDLGPLTTAAVSDLLVELYT